WTLVVIGLWLTVGLDRPDEWAPYLDRAISADVRKSIYALLTFAVTPIGMLTVLRDVFVDPAEPLWLKLAAPGMFLSIYALLLAWMAAEVGEPILLAVDPVVARLFPSLALGAKATGGLTWLARFGGLLLMIAGIPSALGCMLGFLTGTGRARR